MSTVDPDKKDEEPAEKPELAPELDTFYEEAVKAEAHGQEKIGTEPLPARKKKGEDTRQRPTKLDGSQELIALLEEAEKLQAKDAQPVKSMKLQEPDEEEDEDEESRAQPDPPMEDAEPMPSPMVLIAVSALVTLVLAALLILGLELL